MARLAYAAADTLHDARARYFAASGFDERSYTDAWVHFRAGPLRFAIPNTDARRRAVRIHDLHHVLTGYDTSWTGEAEIAAWELGSGCAGFAAAWVLNFFAAAIGLAIAPRAVAAAFARGRRSANLYQREWNDGVLERRVGELQRELHIPA